jgi:uncharacterized repeat protein (TIGR03803 family)
MKKIRQLRSLTLHLDLFASTLALAIVFLLTLLASPVAQAQIFSVIHTFEDGVDGAGPLAGVTLRGNALYGRSLTAQGKGSVYQIQHVGSNWVIVPIALLPSYSFARVVFGPDGHPYGTTNIGGAKNDGTVFDLIVPLTICKTANCLWKENVLYQFEGGSDGRQPGYGDLIWDQKGSLYGTTNYGGPSDEGTVYQMTKSGNNWTESPIYSFSGSDGSTPIGGVILDKSGNLLGTTEWGGLYGFGTVFELTNKPGVGWVETVLYSFQNSTDGERPFATLALDSSGNLYGTTIDGGSGGGGTVFELLLSGDTWIFKLLYSFSGPQDQGCGPLYGLTLDAAGNNLYGTTNCDGTNAFGNVFRLSNTGNGWAYSSLYDFTGGNDGANPISNVTIDPNDSTTLYGTAEAGGDINNCNPPYGCGVVWVIKP